MLTTIAVVAVGALGLGVILGWLLGSPRVHRAEVARAVAQTRLEEMEMARATVGDAFAAEAQKAFRNVGESLVTMNKTQVDGSLETKRAEIEALLAPLREMLDQYRGEVVKSERVRNEAYGGLQQQILSLLSAQQSAQREASRLANALQSPTVRGSWGENSLKRCVEMAGMSEFCDFDTQETFFGDEGRRVRPDLIVRLPNKRVIAVDAKVPLTEFQAAANEPDEAQKQGLLLGHAKTLRRHIDSLSRREYQYSIGETLDFTVMFLPGEHFLSAALVTDASLFEYAVNKKIYLASPTVLLPLLRAVAAGWKAERTEENAKRMHDAGVELFNRFVKMMELFADLGSGLARTVEKYNAVVRSIDSRLWPKAEELQRMSGSGKDLAAPEQIEAVPLESSKLRLTMQDENPADVVPFEK
ncbi:MAG TPA: DNA recombination protein RmuC [Thermoanaerobaculia bacterium]|nr:DNA recombination protein RmuC [Thermoanaerobaculia bacterium]